MLSHLKFELPKCCAFHFPFRKPWEFGVVENLVEFGALQVKGKLALGGDLTTLGEPAPWLVVSTMVNSQNTFKLFLDIRYIPMLRIN
jgi:hypothetical protein